MQYLGRLRYPVQTKDPNLVKTVLRQIQDEVEKLGFVVTTNTSEETVSFTAEPGITIDDSNILRKVLLAEQQGNRIAKQLNVQFDFASTNNGFFF